MSNKKIKILRIVTRLNVGGVSFNVILLSAHLDKNQFETVLVKGKEGRFEGNMNELLREKGISPIVIPELKRNSSLLDDLIAFFKICSIIRINKPDIVHTHLSKAGFLGRLAARLVGVRVVVHTFHGHIFNGFFSDFKSSIFLFLERRLASFSTCLVAVNRMVYSDLVKLKIAKGKCRVIENGFDLRKFVEIERHCGIFRKELGLDQTHILVGCVSRLVPLKGLTYLLEAAADFLLMTPKLRLVIVGDGELRDELQHQADALGIRERVFFTGFRTDLENIYSDFDIVVLSSLTEGLPTVIIEALCAGLPVVATRVGAVPDLITAETGVIIEPRDSKAIAGAVREMVKRVPLNHNPQIRKKFGQRFGVKRLVEDTERLYSQLVSWKGRGF